VKRLLEMFRAAFPDIEYRVDALLEDGAFVVARTTTRGTHSAAFMGHAATGKGFVATGVDIFRVGDGRLVERWGEFDTFGMLQQLGLVPAPWLPGRRAQ
jgi:predicted ester cyclase